VTLRFQDRIALSVLAIGPGSRGLHNPGLEWAMSLRMDIGRCGGVEVGGEEAEGEGGKVGGREHGGCDCGRWCGLCEWRV
jgi:hypothetical protein